MRILSGLVFVPALACAGCGLPTSAPAGNSLAASNGSPARAPASAAPGPLSGQAAVAPGSASAGAPRAQAAGDAVAPLPPGKWQPPASLIPLLSAPGVEVSYREEMTHDHYTVPLWQTAFDPRIYAGLPLGRYGVTAFATVSITRGDRVLGDYTAKVHVQQNYGLYYGPTYMQLEREARGQVREKLDEQMLRDRARLAAGVRTSPVPEQAETE